MLSISFLGRGIEKGRSTVSKDKFNPPASQTLNQPARTRLSAPLGVVVGRVAHVRAGGTYRTSRAYVFTEAGVKRIGD